MTEISAVHIAQSQTNGERVPRIGAYWYETATIRTSDTPVSLERESLPVFQWDLMLARCVLLLLAILPAAAAPIVLFDGSLGTLPAAQGWTTLGVASQSVGSGVLTFDSYASSPNPENSLQDGIQRFVTSPFPLDLAGGIHLRIDLRVNAEQHASNDRAGLSLIVIGSGSTGTQGLELAFWENEIWAQNAGFTHGEGAAFDTTASMVSYDLFLSAAGYRLFANGQEILDGALRDYSGFGFPYSLSNFLFLGDNTTSAAGSFDLSRIEIDQASIPEPGSVGLVLAGFGACYLSWRRKRSGV